MIAFLQAQMDYILFVHGLTLVTIAVVCLTRRGHSSSRLPWPWLGAYAALFALYEWLELLALAVGDPSLFPVVRCVILLLSLGCLLEFGRAGGAATGGRVLGRWVLLPLSIPVALGALHGAEGLSAACRVVMGLVGAGWVAAGLARKARLAESGHRWLYVLSAGLVGHAALTGALSLPSWLVGETWAQLLSVTGAVSAVIEPIAVLAAMAAAYALAAFFQSRRGERLHAAGLASCRYVVVVVTFVLLAVLTAGWQVTQKMTVAVEGQMRFVLGLVTNTAAAGMPAGQIASLGGVASDVHTNAYDDVDRHLAAFARANHGWERARLIAVRDGRCVVLAESRRDGGRPALPGTVVAGVSPERLAALGAPPPPPGSGGPPRGDEPGGPRGIDAIRHLLRLGPPGSPGPPPGAPNGRPPGPPVHSRPPAPPLIGTLERNGHASCLAPVMDDERGEVVAALLTDINAGMLQRNAAAERLQPMAITLLVSLLLIGFAGVQQWSREATARIAASERRFRDIADSSADWMWEFDVRKGYTYCSERIADTLG